MLLYLFLLFCLCFWYQIQKPSRRLMSRNSQYMFYSKSFMIQVFNPFCLDFCIWCRIAIPVSFFPYGCVQFTNNIYQRDSFAHFVLLYMYVCVSHSIMFDSCDPMDCDPPCSSVHGLFLMGKDDWSGLPFLLQEIFSTRDRTWVSHMAGRCFFTLEPPINHISLVLFLVYFAPLIFVCVLYQYCFD